MKAGRRFLLFTVVGFSLSSICVPAQILNVLHTFSGNTYSNLDGAGPATSLLLSGNTLYGAAGGGANGSGTNNSGTVFSTGTDGSAFTVLHTFGGVTNSGAFPPVALNADGADPQGTLILSGDTLYGTAGGGGTNGSGTVFAISTNGMVFSVLRTFEAEVPDGPFPAMSTNSEGANPNSLVLFGDTLYGTANAGGTNGFGTIFSIKTNGNGFTVLHTFKTLDGKNPQSSLAVADGVVYGRTPIGGTNGSGTVFSIATNGANFKVIHTFVANGVTQVGPYLSGLLLSGGTLFGTDSVGGTNATGSIFSLNTNGSDFTVIYNFSANGTGTNLDGVNPEGALMLSGDTLYGTASLGGAHNDGTVFSVNTNGSQFSTLYTFTKLQAATNVDGAHPRTGLVLGGASLFGTAYFGGGHANGTVFSLAVEPTITSLTLAGTNAVINAINGLAGRAYTVLSSTNISLPLNQWNSVATNTLAGGGSFSITATNAVDNASAAQFYILQMQ
jgi:uncharacterized repeat protein (TIGR03803 family)